MKRKHIQAGFTKYVETCLTFTHQQLRKPQNLQEKRRKTFSGRKPVKQILYYVGKKVCVLFAVCVIHARQDSPGEGTGGVWGEQLQPSHCINRGLPQISGWSPVVQQLPESGRFYSLLLRMFLFLALAFLSFAALPSSTEGSTQLSFLRNCTGDSGPWNHLSHQQFWCRHVQGAWASSPAPLLAKLIPQDSGEL